MPHRDHHFEIQRTRKPLSRKDCEGVLEERAPPFLAPRTLALAARREGLIVAAGPRFGIDGAFERFLRLPICYSPETTDAAVQALARAWRSLAQSPVSDPEPELLASVV